MLPLAGDDFPKTNDELRCALGDGLKNFGAKKNTIELGGAFPNFSSLKIDLTAGGIDANLRPATIASREKNPGIEIARIEISAAPLLVCGAPVNFLATADSARLDFARDKNGNKFLAPAGVRDATVAAQIQNDDLQKLAFAIAAKAAEEHGATLESIALTLTSRGPRSLDFAATITASLFMSVTIRAHGRLDIDDGLNAKFSNLACGADGMIGAMAAGVVRPVLEKLQARPIALRDFAFGGLHLHDVKIDAGEMLRVQASFAGGE